MAVLLLVTTLTVGFCYQALADTGTVKWYNKDKGYGFIRPDNGGPDVFVPSSSIRDMNFPILDEGQKVKFDILRLPNRVQAMNVQIQSD